MALVFLRPRFHHRIRYVPIRVLGLERDGYDVGSMGKGGMADESGQTSCSSATSLGWRFRQHACRINEGTRSDVYGRILKRVIRPSSSGSFGRVRCVTNRLLCTPRQRGLSGMVVREGMAVLESG